eukprot:3559375-Pyramimonas_sp.AAC.1
MSRARYSDATVVLLGAMVHSSRGRRADTDKVRDRSTGDSSSRATRTLDKVASTVKSTVELVRRCPFGSPTSEYSTGPRGD